MKNFNLRKEEISTIHLYKIIAAFFIVLIHFDFFTNIKLSSIYYASAIHFFFVLSGYLFGLKNYQNFSIKNNLISVKKKLIRLYPLHFLILAIFMLLEIAKYYLPIVTGVYPNYIPFIKNNMESFIANIFLLNGFAGNPLSFNGPSWFVSALFYSHIIFCFFIVCFRKFIYTLILFFIIFYTETYSEKYYSIHGFGIISNSLFAMAAGYLTSSYLYRKKNIYYVVELLTLFVIILFLLYKQNYLSFITIAFSIILFLTTKYEKQIDISKIVSKSLLEKLGTMTYSIYMLHSLIFWLVCQFLRFFFNVKFINVGGVYKIDLNYNLTILLIFILFLLTIIVSRFSYKYVELRLGNYLVKKTL